MSCSERRCAVLKKHCAAEDVKGGMKVNVSVEKNKGKVVTFSSVPDIEDLLKKGEIVKFCRCWRSKSFPYCDGSHDEVHTLPVLCLSEVYTDTHVPQVHEWGSQEGREYAQDFTPYEPVVDWRKISSWREQEDLPKKVLAYKEKMYKELKSERDDFTKRYGERADEVMHATAMTMAKRKYGYT